MAAEDTEASLKGLPNAKTTRYIEMGKSEMEVSGIGGSKEASSFVLRFCWGMFKSFKPRLGMGFGSTNANAISHEEDWF